MKRLLLSLFLCLFSTLFYAQNDKYVYLDSLGRETKAGDHKTYRIIKDYKKKQKAYNVNEYYFSGNIKSEGLFSDNEAKKREGFFIEYYENGKVKSRTMYTDNMVYGDFTTWYENGNKKMEGEYIIDNYAKPVCSNLKIKNSWNESNESEIIDGNGIYYEKSDLEFSKGKIKNGFKHDVWEGRTEIGNLTFKETYRDGKLIEGISTDSLNNIYRYKEIELQARPKNGLSDFYKTYFSKLDIPDVDPSINEIRVMFSFVIEKDGSISEIKTVKSFDPKTDKSFMKILSKLENWLPACHRGLILRSSFTLPVTIKISQPPMPYGGHGR